MRHRSGTSVVIAFVTLIWLGCAKQTPSSPALRSQPTSGAAALDEKIAEVEKYKMEHTTADTSRAQLSEDCLLYTSPSPRDS